MQPNPFDHPAPTAKGIAGRGRKRMLLLSAAAGAVVLAGASLPPLLAVPVAALTTLIATAIGISSRLITIDHG